MGSGTPEQRFNAKWTPDPNSGCWLWTAADDGRGYGAFKPSPNAPTVKAHRFSWQLKHGPIPKGMSVCHKCDVRSCVNPDHLFLGPQGDNLIDALRKGRLGVCGSKLTKQQVVDILNDKRTPTEIARDYPVTMSNISKIKTGAQWAWLAAEMPERR